MSRNDGHNVLNTKVVFFKGTPVEIPLGMSALAPLTTEHGMVNDELMDWCFAYYHTYGPQNAFEECVIANSLMWQNLNSHVSKHGPTENSLEGFVKRRATTMEMKWMIQSSISGCSQMCQHKQDLGSVVGLC